MLRTISVDFFEVNPVFIGENNIIEGVGNIEIVRVKVGKMNKNKNLAKS